MEQFVDLGQALGQVHTPREAISYQGSSLPFRILAAPRIQTRCVEGLQPGGVTESAFDGALNALPADMDTTL